MSKNKKYIDRREFIVTGSLVAAAMSLPSAVMAAPKAASAVLGLSVGFLGETAGGRFVAANSLLTGDPTLFSRGAGFSFRGMQRFPGDAMRATVDVIYHTDAGDLPFFAFTHSEGKKGVVNNSAPSSFVVPVPTTGSIDLSVKAARAASAEAQATVSFAVNTSGATSSLKLNRGAYIYAFSDRAVDWSSVRLANGAEPSTYLSGSPLLLRMPSGQDVTFDYVVMTVRAAA